MPPVAVGVAPNVTLPPKHTVISAPALTVNWAFTELSMNTNNMVTKNRNIYNILLCTILVKTFHKSKIHAYLSSRNIIFDDIDFVIFLMKKWRIN